MKTTDSRLQMLISLHKGYGLGDAVQMSAVLRHVVGARPNWLIDYQAEEGKHQVGRGIVTNTFAYGKPYPSEYYDGEVQLILYDTWKGYQDRPNTRVASCLEERLDLPWVPEYGRYQINVSDRIRRQVKLLLGDAGYVAVHYEGVSARHNKNLTEEQAYEVCCHIDRLGYIPLILDWQYKSTLREFHMLRAPSSWGGNAEAVCAVIQQCRAFVGIDSGPGKCASATDVPTLIVWTGHHPAQYHDPAPNTVHLVPRGYHSMRPICNNPGVIEWFNAHYTTRTYRADPIESIKAWLSKELS